MENTDEISEELIALVKDACCFLHKNCDNYGDLLQASCNVFFTVFDVVFEKDGADGKIENMAKVLNQYFAGENSCYKCVQVN